LDSTLGLLQRPYRFYYGWVIVAVSFITVFFVMGTRVSLGLFYTAILTEYGWGRAETAGAFSLMMVIHAMMSPVWSKKTFSDRRHRLWHRPDFVNLNYRHLAPISISRPDNGRRHQSANFCPTDVQDT